MQKLNTQLVTAIILTLSLFFTKAFAVKDGEKFKDWQGKCEKMDEAGSKKLCGVTQTVFDKDKNPVANVFFTKKDKKTVAFIKVPLMVNLQAGIGLAVDRKELARVNYTLCDPAGCNTIVALSDEQLATLKKGKSMQIGMFLMDKEVSVSASLSGLGAALKAL